MLLTYALHDFLNKRRGVATNTFCKKELELQEPFNPEKYLSENGMDNHKWNDLKKAIIETEYDSWQQLCDIEAKRLRQVNQPINLNPQISLPQVPPNLSEQQIQQFLQTWLSQNLPIVFAKRNKRRY